MISTCCICFEDKLLKKISNCKHLFCEDCNAQCIYKFNKCPLCRQEIQKKTNFFASNTALLKLSKHIGL